MTLLRSKMASILSEVNLDTTKVALFVFNECSVLANPLKAVIARCC
jgi:hypothetical protein